MPAEDLNSWEVLKYLWGLLSAPIFWLWRRQSAVEKKVEDSDRDLWRHLHKTRADLTGHKVHAVSTFVTKEDYRADMREIKEDLKIIISKLDRKADK
tara:strand:+ start:2340 stop:2630 length:291 start_codon:yes stop_codon:yes gene_type:complete